MEESVKDNVLQDEGATLLLNRPLVPIDEYAARESVSAGFIEECGRLGIVQLRRYKGKTFVVDVPLAYPYGTQPAAELSQPGDKSVLLQKAAELVKKHIPPEPPPPAKPARKTGPSKPNTAQQQYTKRLLEVGNKTPAVSEETVEVQEPGDDLFDMQNTEPFEIGEDILELIDESEPVKETPQSAKVPLGRMATAAAGAMGVTERFWRMAAVIFFAALLVATFTSFWFYVDRQAQIDKVEQAYKSTNKVFGAFAESSQQVKQMQNELDNTRGEKERTQSMLEQSRDEVDRIQDELNNSKAEVKAVRSELSEARRNLESLRKNNSEAVEQLNEEIQNLAARLAELTKHTKAVPPPPKPVSPISPDSQDIPGILDQ
jgi:archaellum component FlaC